MLLFPVLIAISSAVTTAASITPPAALRTGREAYPKTTQDWRRQARQIAAVSEERRAAVLASLRSIPTLEQDLRRALSGPDRYLAMDVIGTLKITNLVEDLLEVARQETSGFAYLALASFIEAKNLERFKNIFNQRLTDPLSPPPAKVILLDTLARMEVRIPKNGVFEGLLTSDASPEIRQAALSYLRHFLLGSQPNSADLNLLRAVLQRDPSRPRKIQALYLVSELTLGQRQELGRWEVTCPGRIPARLVRVCEALGSEVAR